MDIRKEVENIFPMLVEQRRHLHEDPELSRREFHTVAYIIERLKAFGLDEVTEIPDGGVIAFIRGGKAPAEGKKMILLRADIDALPIDEPETNNGMQRVVRSKNPGVMHACGHDAH
ncbi:MAG: amidohydrolase, partial [Firmicutes bacterium]|nr:amidohydrolase [Bacillota bacterium]